MSSSLGVDLVEYKKAKRFYREHGENLPSIFTAREVLYIRRAKTPYKNLAKLLAAKEAAYKADPTGYFMNKRVLNGGDLNKGLSAIDMKKGIIVISSKVKNLSFNLKTESLGAKTRASR